MDLDTNATEAIAFRQALSRFCEWVESDVHRLIDARGLLMDLIRPIPSLQGFRGMVETEQDFSRVQHEMWKETMSRLADLPLNHYRVIFDPLDFTENEPVVGSLADDFADIYGDLQTGLEAHGQGFAGEALALWIDSYFYHWGRHACSALAAIDAYFREEQSYT